MHCGPEDNPYAGAFNGFKVNPLLSQSINNGAYICFGGLRIMQSVEIILMLYGTVALFALAMTHRERHQTGQKSLMLSALGWLACAVWPLTICAMMLSMQRRAA